jgi:homoserine O-acetyltransferase/O-succinyltransferase
VNTFLLGDFPLISGTTLPAARLAYQTFGELNEDKSNAVLFPTFLGAPAGVLTSWIGPGRPLDPARYFIILPGMFGLPDSSAPSNTAAPYAGAEFPAISIADDVNAQYRLVTEELGIERLHLVLGWSVGALQVYQWAVRHADAVRAIAPIGGAPVPAPWTKLWLGTIVEDAILGNLPRGKDAAMTAVAHGAAVTAPPRTFYDESDPGWRAIGFSSEAEYVAGFWEAFWLAQDPQDVVAQARKARTSTLDEAGQPTAEILKAITAKTVVAACTGDNLFPPSESERLADAIPGAQYREIPSRFGHLATFGLSPADVAAIDGVIAEALEG